MKAARRSTAFLSGCLLYCFCIGVAIKYADIGLPRHVYLMLGGRNNVMVMLGEAAVVAAVLLLVALLWSYLTLKPARRRHRPYVGWMMSGVGLAWAVWLIAGAFSFALKPRAYSAPMQSMLLSSNAAPLYGAFNIFGVMGGVWLAGLLARKKQLSLPTTRSRRRPQAQGAAMADAGEDSAVSTVGPHTVAPPH